jgi:hypothetical protein
MTAVVYETQHQHNPAIGNYLDAFYFTVTTLTTTTWYRPILRLVPAHPVGSDSIGVQGFRVTIENGLRARHQASLRDFYSQTLAQLATQATSSAKDGKRRIPILHVWQSQSHDPHGLDQVQFQRATPVIVSAVGNARAAAATADIVDQDVDAAIGRDGGLDQPACLIGTADIAGVSRNLSAGRAQGRFRFAQLLGRAS